MELKQIIDYLRTYRGKELKIMEVCGTHTASIFNSGIRSIISPRIKLISGPGCPVCVTPSSYIDRCIEYALKKDHILMTFGDMIKVPGGVASLAEAKGEGASVEIMYSPFAALKKAKNDPDTVYVLAAVGFETTAPAYALMIKNASEEGVHNIKLVTSLKSAIPALQWICDNDRDIDGFICPGHVSVITGSSAYVPLAEKYGKPFAIAGFEAEHILAALYSILKQIRRNEGKVENLYKNAVTKEGNVDAVRITDSFFEKGPAMWRGIGVIRDSGLYLRKGFHDYDGGSKDLIRDRTLPAECRCKDVIVGRISPDMCPMFGEKCKPSHPFGPCMVSAEGSCGIWYRNVY